MLPEGPSDTAPAPATNELDPALCATAVAPSITADAAPSAKIRAVESASLPTAEAPLVEASPQRPYTVRLAPAKPRALAWKVPAAAIGAAAILGVALLLRRPPASLPQPAMPLASATAALEPSAVPPAVPGSASAPAAGACPVLCCGGTACVGAPNNARGCSSGRACVPGSCDSRIPPSGDWLLRVAGASANGKEISPRPEVCLRRSTPRSNEPWSCAPAGSGDPRAPRLHVTTAELAEGGVDISIKRSPKGPAILGKGVHMGGVGVAALCKGLNLRFAGTDHLAYAVTIFLDDARDEVRGAD
jgi:hypothetical protein